LGQLEPSRAWLGTRSVTVTTARSFGSAPVWRMRARPAEPRISVARRDRTRAPTGFAYLLPARVPWIDATGSIDDGSQRPVCLPYYHAVRVGMETVKFPIAGGYQGTVLWVRC
jgi:hypothetical protein